jgi:glycine betaine/proline transport system substrate-binding protein
MTAGSANLPAMPVDRPSSVLAVLTAIWLALCGHSLAQEAPAAPAPESESVLQLEPPPPPCGTQPITIAKMQWPSAQILAEIHARMLRQSYDCDVSVVPGDLSATGSSMGSTGQPAVAPEMWLARIADLWNPAVTAQSVRQAGTSYVETAFEGWFIPDYVAAAQPELTSAESLKTMWTVLADGAPKAKFISCPADWGCALINRHMLKALGLEPSFEVVEPANRFELDTLIAEAVSRREPVLFYYWQPNSVLAQFPFVSLDLGPYNKDAFACLGRIECPLPQPSGFAPDPVVIAVAEWVFLEAPEVAAYFTRAKMPIAEMNSLLYALTEPGATIETVADKFVAERGDVWRSWVGQLAPAAPATVIGPESTTQEPAPTSDLPVVGPIVIQ